MIATYRVLSAALSYPTKALQDAGGELIAALNMEQLLPDAHRATVGALLRDLSNADLFDAQSRYVDLFDRTRSLSLHLFEHVHGESRDRGQAMVSLLERYRQAGFDVAANELPDFIPLFVEFLATQPTREARAMLAEPAHILAALGVRLRKRGSDYAAIMEALVALSEVVPSAEILSQLRERKMEDPSDFVALDEAWEETEVRFGPDDTTADGCPRVSDILRRMDSPPETADTERLQGVAT